LIPETGVRLSILIKNASYVLTQDKERRVLNDLDNMSEASRMRRKSSTAGARRSSLD